MPFRYAFVYIRQLTIHLRNAMHHHHHQSTTESKGPKGKGRRSPSSLDPMKTVYNWQYVHSAHLWVQLLSDAHPSPALEPLVYPLIQLVCGAVGLASAPAFYPMRFHLCRLLSNLSAVTGLFVPVLPYYLEILNSYGGFMRSKKGGPGGAGAKVSMRPMDFSCIVRVSKGQLAESGFRDAVMDQICSGIIECCSRFSHRAAFPELAVPVLVQLRSFLKRCRVQNYQKKVKHVLEKVKENVTFVEQARASQSFSLKDAEKLRAWEAELLQRQGGTPLSKYYESWQKVKEQRDLKLMAKKDQLDDDNYYSFIPKVERKASKKPKAAEFKGIFGGDDDESEDDGVVSNQFLFMTKLTYHES